MRNSVKGVSGTAREGLLVWESRERGFG